LNRKSMLFFQSVTTRHEPEPFELKPFQVVVPAVVAVMSYGVFGMSTVKQ